MIRFNLDRMHEAHQAAGAISTVERGLWRDQPGHLLGTARMGTDPSTSVVDRFGRAHDVSNLFIVDGSVFVTAGAMNPTSMICALALRTAEHIVEWIWEELEDALPLSSLKLWEGDGKWVEKTRQ